MKPALLDALVQARAEKRPVAFATNLLSGESHIVDLERGDGLAASARAALKADRPQLVATERGDIFINVFNPPLRLALVGAVHIALPLSTYAAIAGYDVTVIDPRSAFSTAERFPGVSLSQQWPDEALAAFGLDTRSAVVTLTHDPKLDDAALDVALRSPAFYIGALGSKKTHAARLSRLAAKGHGENALARIHGPVGLAIGAKSPAEIAVSILAQMTETLRKDGAA